MSVNNLNDSVGKKIVEALRMQDFDLSEQDAEQVAESAVSEESSSVEFSDNVNSTDNVSANLSGDDFHSFTGSHAQDALGYPNPKISAVDAAFQRSLENNFPQINSDVEYPNNLAVLMNLMTKLPTGVSRQTAALIISQTMEALGIPMSSVIQEAKQFQDSLSDRARECQKNIIDFRNRINALEVQGQQYQKQVIKINDIISLFTRS